jgi:hypothetical protein
VNVLVFNAVNALPLRFRLETYDVRREGINTRSPASTRARDHIV